jgi:hypothetical protein
MSQQLALELPGVKFAPVAPLERIKIVIDGVTERFDTWLDKHPKLKAVFELFAAGATLHVAIELMVYVAIAVVGLVAIIH